jgi:hypothetical protein
LRDSFAQNLTKSVCEDFLKSIGTRIIPNLPAQQIAVVIAPKSQFLVPIELWESVDNNCTQIDGLENESEEGVDAHCMNTHP